MKTRTLIHCFCLLLLAAGVASCTEDDFTALSPEFSDMTFARLDGGTDFHVGDKIVGTAVQSRQGKYLYKATYEWSCQPEGGEHKYVKGAVYDNNQANPTDTIVFNAAGTYKVIFKGRYHISSSDCETRNFTVDITDGQITYSTPSWMYYDVKIEKQIRVKP